MKKSSNKKKLTLTKVTIARLTTPFQQLNEHKSTTPQCNPTQTETGVLLA